ncbi:MAG: gliding motility-associated C-terminal domain-containing protein [Bacteroidota bacterium]|nr:gliding motility-associated C-terminal domain-containing protein [Bacteroidota bacterium]
MNIDQLFKSKLDNGTSPIDKELWQKIDSSLDSHNTNNLQQVGGKQSWLSKTWQGMSMVTKITSFVISAIIVVGGIVLVNNNYEKENEVLTNSKQHNQTIQEDKSSEPTIITTTEQQQTTNTKNNIKKENEELFFETEQEIDYTVDNKEYLPSFSTIENKEMDSKIESHMVKNNEPLQEKNLVETTRQETKINIFIPNYITPNGDEINDCFEIKNIENYPDNTLIIRDRKGKKVYQQNSYNNDFCGDNCIAGTYFYVLNIRINNQVKQYSGTIEIIK